MRKVLSLVLVLALVLGSFSMAFAATPTDVVGTPSETAVSVLTDLGVVSGYADGTFKPAGIVTRAEMAKLIVAALGLSEYATGTTTKYSDMAGATWAQGYVSYATGLGVVSGYPDGTFKPSAPVSYAEAAAMIVRALGYTEKSLLPATWPANFVVKAKALGLFDDVKSTVGGANRGDVALMIYAALNSSIGTVDADNKWTASNSGTAEKPVYDTMLDRLGTTEFDAAVITGDEATKVNLRAYVGAYASVYRDGPKLSDDILFVKAVDSTFFTGKFAADVLTPSAIAKDAKFNVTKDDVDYALKAAVNTTDVAFFLNGESVTKFDVTSKTSVTIAAEVSGVKITDLYSILKWNIDHRAMITSSELKTITASTPKLLGDTFVLDDNDKIDLTSFELIGVAKLSDIAVDNVVYVYKGLNDIRRIAVGTTVVTGEITKINSDGDYTIGGKVYSKAATMGTGTDTVVAGDSVKAYLDAYGDVYKFVLTEGTADNFAIALEVANGTTGLNGKAAVAKLFLADGTDKIFAADETEVNNLISVTGTGTALSWTTTPAINIVKYGVDKDGVLDSVKIFNTATTNAGYSFVSVGGIDVTDKGTYNGKAIATNAIIFTTDTLSPASKDEGDWSVSTLAKIKGIDNVNAWYVVDTDTNQIVVIALAAGSSSTVDYGVLTDWAQLPSTADYNYEVSAIVGTTDVTKNADDAVYQAAKTTDSAFYAFGYDSTGAFKTATVVTSGGSISGETFKYQFATSSAIENNGSVGTYTLDANVIVYVYDAGYALGDRSDIDGTKKQLLVCTDGDGVFEYVIVGSTYVAY